MRDPATLAERLPPGRLCIDYDALVEHPREVAAEVRRRLAPMRCAPEWFRCSAEFATVAIQHAARGRLALETQHETVAAALVVGGDVRTWATPLDCVRVAPSGRASPSLVASTTPKPSDGERPSSGLAGTAPRGQRASAWLTVVATSLAVVVSLAASPSPRLAVETLALAPHVWTSPEAPTVQQPTQPAMSTPDFAPAIAEGTSCRTLWAETLHACAKLDRRHCVLPLEALGDVSGAAPARGEERGIDRRAFANFCRAACRHRYLPAYDDFRPTVCGRMG